MNVQNSHRDDLPYWAAFSRYERIGPLRFRRLHAHFPSMADAWKAGIAELKTAGLELEVAEDFVIKRQEIDPDKEWSALGREGITLLPFTDAGYPALLSEIYNAPYLLYVRGTLRPETDRNIAVVGTRKITEYGKRATEEIAADLVRSGLNIVSGLALGIDAVAHETAVAEGGYTIAVLGSGIDRSTVYPVHNRRLADRILEAGGAVISEYPPGTMGLKHHFPNRNRIIAGLSLGTVVIEAAEASGALITAKLALEQNREVFAVPGSIYNPSSEGPNALIKQGAHPVVTSADILEVFHLEETERFFEDNAVGALTDEEEVVFSRLGKEPAHIDELTRAAGLPPAKVSSIVSMLEIKGRAKHLGGMRYIKSR